MGLAFLFLRRGDTKRAAGLYLDVEDIDRKNKTARRALSLLRRYGGEELSAWTQSKKARRLYPPLPGGRQVWRRFLPPLAVTLAASLIGGGIFFAVKRLSLPPPPRGGLEAAALTLTNEEKSDAVETDGVYRDILTINQVLSLYDEARVFFNGYRDEKAKYTVNRLLRSNASLPIKNRARLLISLTAPPKTPDNLKDNFTYAEVRKDPALYNDCYVNWKGLAMNVTAGDKALAFDFLVDFDAALGAWEGGSIRVEAPAYDLNSGTAIEVLGKIIAGRDGGFSLAAQLIHPLDARRR